MLSGLGFRVEGQDGEKCFGCNGFCDWGLWIPHNPETPRPSVAGAHIGGGGGSILTLHIVLFRAFLEILHVPSSREGI